MRKMNTEITIQKLFDREMVFPHRYYVAEQLRNGDTVKVSRNFAFQADAAAAAKEMARKDHGRGGKFVVITIV